MLCSMESGLFSTGGIGGGGGECGRGAAEEVYLQQFSRMLVDNCGLKPQPQKWLPRTLSKPRHFLGVKGGYFRTVYILKED